MSGRKIAGYAPDTWLRWAAALALAALAMIVWSILDPSPIPIIVSMSVGQALGTLSLLLFLFVVFMDLRAGPRGEFRAALGTTAYDPDVDAKPAATPPQPTAAESPAATTPKEDDPK